MWRRNSACTFVLRKLRLCVLAISHLRREGGGSERQEAEIGVAIVAFEVFACAFSGGCDAVIIDILMHVFLK